MVMHYTGAACTPEPAKTWLNERIKPQSLGCEEDSQRNLWASSGGGAARAAASGSGVLERAVGELSGSSLPARYWLSPITTIFIIIIIVMDT